MSVNKLHQICRGVLNRRILISLVLMWCIALPAKAFDVIAHDLDVELFPAESRLVVKDAITVPDHQRGKSVSFVLHGDLTITQASLPIETVSPAVADAKDYDVPVKHYRLTLPAGENRFSLQYHGVINHPIAAPGQEYERSMSETPGLIESRGVFLATSTLWYPVVKDTFVHFILRVTLPENWSAVSQGKRSAVQQAAGKTQVTWEEHQPQDDIYLIANRYVEYLQASDSVQAMVFLREQDDALAQKYLDTTHQYIAMYSRLLGQYPYGKFALVENFWDTGYGMPSFTLLGPKVIRFPFILHSSYPHEILHNWWGNGVFVAYESGNWAEGLTAYLADHLIKQQRGEGTEYRRSVLQKYTDFVTSERDFPLTEFRVRHSASTEAVGYGKTMMFFHMLRQQLGDAGFVRALRAFYQEHKFDLATFADVQRSFEQSSDTSLALEFSQWVNRVGAPALRIVSARSESAGGKYRVSVELEQRQPGEAYKINVPVAVHMEGVGQAHQTVLTMQHKQQVFDLEVEGKPLRVDIDPQFDVFRRLHPREIPAALSQGFGAENILVLIPSAASTEKQAAYWQLAKSWQQSQEGSWQVKTDAEVRELPTNLTVWLLGWENKFRSVFQSALGKAADISDSKVQVGGGSFERGKHSVLLTARHPANEAQTLLWLVADNSAALPGLARKLPHYRKYSYLAFEGDEPNNVAKGQWDVTDSPMVSWLDTGEAQQKKITSTVKQQEPLAELPPVFSKERMLQDIRFMASDSMAGRELGSKELDAVAERIMQAFKEAGLQPGADDGQSYYQRWQQEFEGKGTLQLSNVVGVIPGVEPAFNNQSVIISAHYDHLGKGWPDVHQGDAGKIHHGADDNASGVAVMLEVARQIAQWKPKRTIVFIAFTGEETQRAGSKYYVANAKRYPAQSVMGVINLDTVGRLVGNPLTVFGIDSAREWVHIFRGVGFVTGIKINNVANDFGFSDQKSFLDADVPGVQLFGSVHQDYHRPGDTVDKIDADGLVKVATVLKEAVEYLANREEPLTVNLQPSATEELQASGKPQAGRKVSLGTVPDFEYQGQGVRITGTVEDSPAQHAGLREGDIITNVGGSDVKNLRDFARILRGMQPGDRTTVQFTREGETKSAEVRAEAR